MDKPHIVVLGDAEQALRRLGDWQAIDQAARVTVHHLPLHGAALLTAMQEADVLVLLRDRIPLDAATIAQLPRLRYLVFTGSRNTTLDAAALAARGINIAAGENVSTLEGFATLIPSLAYVQPSVTKVGGIPEFLRVADAIKASGKRMAAHSPYFGPGDWASLQLAATLENFNLFEYLYVDQEAWCGLNPPKPVNGFIAIPDKPGLGFEPDPSVVEQYRVG
jgi:hypothetical protein